MNADKWQDRLIIPAHDLKHFNDPGAIDYLDDLLGHPVTDPHGEIIPENAMECAPGNLCRVSALREGRSAVIEEIPPGLEGLGLTPGNRVPMGPRVDGGATLTLMNEHGDKRLLNHEQVDAVRARLLI